MIAGSKQFTVIFKNAPESPPDKDIHVSVPPGLSVLEAARRGGVDIDAPCSGNGTCGKCLVRVLSGRTEGTERSRHIDSESWEGGWRLACQTKITDNLTALVPGGASPFKSRMRITGLSGMREREIFEKLKKEMEEPGFAGDGGLELVSVELAPPRLDEPRADRERLLGRLAETCCPAGEEAEIDLHALRKLPAVLRGGNFSCACVIRREERTLTVLDVFPPSRGGPGGKKMIPVLAVDIGTTTVAVILSDLLSGELLAAGSEGNPQIRYGADVINRIIESARPGGLERLRRALLEDCLIPLIGKLAAEAGIEGAEIYRAAVAANTTMTHLFAGVSPEYLRLEPYVPAFFHGGFRGGELGLPIHPDAEVLIAPSVGSYVGGDISAGVFASGISRKNGLSLFIDLGTNGELVFGGRDFLMACACSAGPAFEGGDISCGMRAASGAVDSVRIDPRSLEPEFTVIGGGKPGGICGSGLIDLAGELFAAGCINPRGKFILDGEGAARTKRFSRDEWGMGRYVLVPAEASGNNREIFINEGDLDNFIRAKGAIFSAVRTMLAMLDFDAAAIDALYIAGGIGSGVNVEKAVRTGMLPKLPPERYHYIGNTSLAGAWAMAQSRKAAARINEIARGMTYLELSSHPSYMDEFIAACFLPHTEEGLFR